MMQFPGILEVKTEESTAQFEAAFAAFRRAYPAYETTRKLDELRVTEYARLDRLGHVYLDYTGAVCMPSPSCVII